LREALQNDDKSTEVHNSLWLASGSSVQKEFGQLGKAQYDSTIRHTDFGNPSRAASDINSWVKDKTKGDIKEKTTSTDFHAGSNSIRVPMMQTH
jgi:serine protease inhibitor